MIRNILNLWKPELPHSPGFHAAFFEGWYYKCVDRDRTNTVIIIPGIFRNRKRKQNQAFIQVMDSVRHQAAFHTFTPDKFRSYGPGFDIRIGRNTFSQHGLTIDIPSNDQPISGTLVFRNLTPWPVRLLSPGAMGWYAFVPFMQCYHGVLSMDHILEGTLVIDGKAMDYSGGRGYIEKDWGYGFPVAYIWMQCNHFDTPGTSLFVSVARIPWLRGAFRGFLAGFLHAGTLHRFTTYSGSTLESLEVGEERVRLRIRDRHQRLDIEAERTPGGRLYGPDETSFKQNVLETLTSTVRVTLNRIRDGKEIRLFEGNGYPAALELNGQLGRIVDRFV